MRMRGSAGVVVSRAYVDVLTTETRFDGGKSMTSPLPGGEVESSRERGSGLRISKCHKEIGVGTLLWRCWLMVGMDEGVLFGEV